MPTTRDIKRRIKSVKSTQQITKAMKMVSAAKLRKSQTAVQAVRPFTKKIENLIMDLSGSVSHEFLDEKIEIKKVCYLVFGSDRGLCGGFNSNLNRFLDKLLAEQENEYTLAIIGARVHDHCKRLNYPIDFHYSDIGDNPDFYQAKELAQMMAKGFSDHKYDEVYLVYSEFISAMTQQPYVKRLLPVEKPKYVEEENAGAVNDFIFEPSKEEMLKALLPQYVDVDVFTAMQEAKASEHSARMTAMSGATDNAGEMINDLTLSLNRARQAAITTEISEIVGGAAALR